MLGADFFRNPPRYFDSRSLLLAHIECVQMVWVKVAEY